MNAGPLEAVRAEWIKLRTVRSTTWSLLAFAGVSILFSALATWESETSGGSPGNPGDNDIVLDSLSGIWFGQMAAAVLAVLAITSEYSTRMIRTTLAANPRRRTVLAAKTAVVGIVVLVVGLAVSVACFLLGQSILRGNGFTYENGYPAASLADGTPLRAVARRRDLPGSPRGVLARRRHDPPAHSGSDHGGAGRRPCAHNRDQLPAGGRRRAVGEVLADGCWPCEPADCRSRRQHPHGALGRSRVSSPRTPQRLWSSPCW